MYFNEFKAASVVPPFEEIESLNSLTSRVLFFNNEIDPKAVSIANFFAIDSLNPILIPPFISAEINSNSHICWSAT